MERRANRKQLQKYEVRKVASLNAELLPQKNYEICRGDESCCGLKKPAIYFPPSALKCICKCCGKKIVERRRREKIKDNEKRYILEKIKSTKSRVGIFSTSLKCSEEFFYGWIKSQSTDTFNEHLDHVLPVNYFKKFTAASEYLSVRDSWLNIMPLETTKNLQKSSTVNFDLFSEQLKKANEFITKYSFATKEEREDTENHVLKIQYHFLNL